MAEEIKQEEIKEDTELQAKDEGRRREAGK